MASPPDADAPSAGDSAANGAAPFDAKSQSVRPDLVTIEDALAACARDPARSDEVADAAQEVAHDLLRRRDVLVPRTLEEWRRLIAGALSFSLRKRRREERTRARLEKKAEDFAAKRSMSAPAETLVRREAAEIVAEALFALHPADRDLILRRDLGRESPREISRGLSGRLDARAVNAVSVALGRARARVREKLRETYGAEAEDLVRDADDDRLGTRIAELAAQRGVAVSPGPNRSA